MSYNCWVCQKPMTTAGNICDDCVVKLVYTDDEVIETFNDLDGQAADEYRREQEERREPVDYQEQRRRTG